LLAGIFSIAFFLWGVESVDDRFEVHETACALTGNYKGRLRQSHKRAFDLCGKEVRQVGKGHSYDCSDNAKGK
jgi:hypothetical protein